MNCLQVASNNIVWANDLVERLGSDFLDNPTAVGALYVGVLAAGGVVAMPAKTSFDLLKRSVSQLSSLDFIAGIASALLTLTAISLFPIVFLGASAFLLYKVYEVNSVKPASDNPHPQYNLDDI